MIADDLCLNPSSGTISTPPALQRALWGSCPPSTASPALQRALSPAFHSVAQDGAFDDEARVGGGSEDDRPAATPCSIAQDGAFSRQLQWAAFASGVAARLGEEEQAERSRRRRWAAAAAQLEADRSRMLSALSVDDL